jgi:Flp pilus assembly protein TadG
MTAPAVVSGEGVRPGRSDNATLNFAAPDPTVLNAPVRRHCRVRRGAVGSVSVELAVFVVPTLILLAVFVVFCGRAASAAIDVHAAAAAGARAAADATTPAQAGRAAADAVTAVTTGTRWSCATSVDITNFHLGGQVRVHVACTVRMGDLGLPGIGAKTVNATATQPIDTWRAAP